MNEKVVGKILLGLDASQLGSDPDSRALVANVLERDRWRVHMLSMLTIILWTFAAAGILLVLLVLLSLYPKQQQLMRDLHRGQLTEAERDWIQQVLWAVVEKATVMVAVSVTALVLAALGTVLLVHASRRATIRQLNSSLFAISEQLKQLPRR